MIRTASVIAFLSCAVGLASAREKAELSFGVTANQIGVGKLTSADLLGTFEPSVKWTRDGKVAGCDCEAGVQVKEGQGGKGSYSLFADIKRTVGGWNLKARLDTESSDLHCVDTKVHAEGGPTNVMLRAQATVDTVSKTGEVTEVSIEQPFDLLGGEATVFSRFNLVSQKADFVVAYGQDGTYVTVGGDRDIQRVTIRQRIDEHSEIAPTVCTDGDVELEYRCKVGGGYATGIYKPSDSVTVKYAEGPWSANAVIPMEGYFNLQGGAKVSIKRSLDSSA